MFAKAVVTFATVSMAVVVIDSKLSIQTKCKNDTQHCLQIGRDGTSNVICNDTSEHCELSTRAYFENENRYFEMWTQGHDSYVAIALADTQNMGDDMVIQCVPRDTDTKPGVDVYFSNNKRYGNDRLFWNYGLINVTTKRTDWGLKCSFQLQPLVNFGIRFFGTNLLERYYVLLTAGKVEKVEGQVEKIGQHERHYHTASQVPFNFKRKPDELFMDKCTFFQPNCLTKTIQNCSIGNCSIAATFQKSVDSYTFYLLASTDDLATSSSSYVALGLSDQPSLMSPAVVIQCQKNDGNFFISASFNHGKSNSGVEFNKDEVLLLEMSSEVSNTTYCKFKIKVGATFTNSSMNYEKKLFNEFVEKYYIILAAGSAEGNATQWHGPGNTYSSSTETIFINELASAGSYIDVWTTIYLIQIIVVILK